MENDVNNEQVVTAPEDANKEQVVIAPDVNTDIVNQQAADQAAPNQNGDVPYDRFKEVNDQKKKAEEQAAYAQRQLELIQMQQQQPVQQVAPKTTSQQALDSLGITADDLFGENVVKYQEAVNQLENAQRQLGQAAMQTQQFMMSHSDLSEVVGSVNPATGQIIHPTKELLAIVTKKPYLAAASTQDLYAAVLDERRFIEFEKTSAVQQEHQTRVGVDVATQPLGGSAAGGGGSGSQQGQSLLSRDQSLQINADIAAGKYS